MIAFQRCDPCQGNGKIRGGGMIDHDCEECNGKGKVPIPDKEKIKQTDGYKAAKKRLMAQRPDMPAEEVEEALDKAFLEESKGI